MIRHGGSLKAHKRRPGQEESRRRLSQRLCRQGSVPGRNGCWRARRAGLWVLSCARPWACLGAGGGTAGLVVAAGGAAAGATIGALQWLVLRRRARQAGWWILASAAGFGLAGLAVRELLIDTGILAHIWPPGWAAVALGGTAGAIVGIAEWPVLARSVRRAGWWVLASAVGAAAGDAVAGASVGLPPYWRSMLSGVVCEVARGLTLVWLLGNPVPERSTYDDSPNW